MAEGRYRRGSADQERVKEGSYRVHFGGAIDCQALAGIAAAGSAVADAREMMRWMVLCLLAAGCAGDRDAMKCSCVEGGTSERWVIGEHVKTYRAAATQGNATITTNLPAGTNMC